MDPYYCRQPSGPIRATVRVPGSKSLTNRALVAAALADGVSVLRGALIAEDTSLMTGALRALGVAVTVDEGGEAIEVTGCRGHIPANDADIHCGNAGTVMRFVAGLAALGHGRYRLDGVPRMRQRPVGALAAALRQLGALVEHEGEDGFPPLIVHGRGLRGGEAEIDSPSSSQFVSALLLVAPYAMRDVLLGIRGDIPSRPYLTMTTTLMEAFGVSVIEQFTERDMRFIIPNSQRYTGRTYSIEPDASNASYFLAAPAIAGGRVTVTGLSAESLQGDARFIDILERMGCAIERSPDSLSVSGPSRGERLRAVDVDLVDMPDVAQTLAALAVFADGVTTIKGLASLRVKETDRLAALQRELAKLGATAQVEGDTLIIEPPPRPIPAVIDTYDDHRMAMSFALAGLGVPGLVINNPSCCAKTFPGFFDRWERMLSGSAS